MFITRTHSVSLGNGYSELAVSLDTQGVAYLSIAQPSALKMRRVQDSSVNMLTVLRNVFTSDRPIDEGETFEATVGHADGYWATLYHDVIGFAVRISNGFDQGYVRFSEEEGHALYEAMRAEFSLLDIHELLA